jgi:hypothetical protein
LNLIPLFSATHARSSESREDGIWPELATQPTYINGGDIGNRNGGAACHGPFAGFKLLYIYGGETRTAG